VANQSVAMTIVTAIEIVRGRHDYFLKRGGRRTIFARTATAQSHLYPHQKVNQ
jgi:hypothetical protein